MSLNAADINQITNVVDNLIVVEESDLIPNRYVAVPTMNSVNYPGRTIEMQIIIGETRYINGQFVDQSGTPLVMEDYYVPAATQTPPKVV